jgi:hypothetical protein
VQLIQIALAPVRGGKTHPGDEGEQERENTERNPVHMLHDLSSIGAKSPAALFASAPTGSFMARGQINDRVQDRADDDPQELVPVKERNADERRLDLVVEGRPENRDELHEKEQIPPAPAAASLCLRVVHLIHPEGLVAIEN